MSTTERDAAEAALTEWARINGDRDNRIRRALRAGTTKNRIHTITGISRATIDRILDKERTMTTTTEYGSFNVRANAGSTATVYDYVASALGDFAEDYDVDAIAEDFREAINAALPEGVSLAGDEFYGPYHDADKDFDGYPVSEDGALEIAAIVEGVDFWEIAERHDQAGEASSAEL